jgi:hypothetical protein
MVTLKRVLTRKSILGFGYAENRDLSVQMILDLGKKDILINAYFGLEKIDFIEDILDELGITPEFRMIKPSKDYELQKLFFQQRNANWTDEERMNFYSKIKKDIKKRWKRSNAKQSIYSSAEYYRSKNHGNKLK